MALLSAKIMINLKRTAPLQEVEGALSTSITRQHNAQQHKQISAQQSGLVQQSATLATEAAIAIVINGIHYAVLMATPDQLEYLAIGFLFSEGLIRQGSDLLDWEVIALTNRPRLVDSLVSANMTSKEALALSDQLLDYDVYLVNLVLNQRCHQRIQAQKRQLAGRTGCGMCGITGLAQALPNLSAYQQTPKPAPTLNELLSLRQQISTAQQGHLLTGAIHAAAADFNGELLLFEDVGRHNALDKLIGWQVRQKAELNYVVMTSRLSIELVQKVIRAQIPWLVGMSAPTSTAVRTAERYGLGLAGFLRDNRVTYYSGYSQPSTGDLDNN